MSQKRKEDPSEFSPLARLFLWADDPVKVNRMVYGLYAVCVLLFLADFVYLKTILVSAERIPGFYAIYGFVMCAALVICARMMRVVLKRPGSYYAPRDVESEPHPAADLDRIEHNG